MVRDLLLGFVPGDWVYQLDLASFERVNGSYVSDGGHHRHSDMVWRVRLSGEWIYIYLLLEFQSRSDHWMALRMQVYIGLLYQELVKRHELPQPGRLPPVFPVVLYNSLKRWTACCELGELVLPGHPDLVNLQPSQRYLEAEHWNRLSASAAVTGLKRSLNRRIARRLSQVAGRRKLDLQSLVVKEAAMGVPQFDTFIDALRHETQLVGQREQLQRLLVRRFGSVSKRLKKRIENGEVDDLDRWFDRLFDAKNIQDIFAEDVPA
ncbi:Rpn family recombination-promoting nuclease/putative transposase [Rugamonas sp. A1-17]|nr:Rpn family recombination-promoting nuclease/putative transposase [Rugamonas sp. A1-17]